MFLIKIYLLGRGKETSHRYGREVLSLTVSAPCVLCAADTTLFVPGNRGARTSTEITTACIGI